MEKPERLIVLQEKHVCWKQEDAIHTRLHKNQEQKG